MSRIVTLNIGASRAVLAEYAVRGKTGLTLTAYGSADLTGLDWEAEGAAEAVLVPALREAAKSAGIKPGPLNLALNGQMVFPRFTKFPSVSAACWCQSRQWRHIRSQLWNRSDACSNNVPESHCLFRKESAPSHRIPGHSRGGPVRAA